LHKVFAHPENALSAASDLVMLIQTH
jgi:hypothetical protein